MQKHVGLTIIAAGAGVAVWTLLLQGNRETEVEIEEVASEENSLNETTQLTADLMLADHGLESTPVARDAELIWSFVEAAHSEYRHLDISQLFNNTALTELLVGKPEVSRRQISNTHPVLGLNEHKEPSLIDRWGTAYHIHFRSHQDLEVVSAGPDRRFATADDFRWPPSQPDSVSQSP